MKKALSVLLLIITLFTLCACSKQSNAVSSDTQHTQPEETSASAPVTPTNEGDKLLPYSLKFGMSYDEARKACKGFPNIEKAKANDGFASSGFSPDAEDYWTFFGIDNKKLYDTNGVVMDPQYYYSFNESKKLYEFMVMSRIYYSERAAEYLFNTYLDHYNKKANAEFEINETNNELVARCETNTLRISVIMEIEDDSFLIYTVIHNKTHELSK